MIIVTSGGRTGTKFFSNLFREIIDGCISVHEPETINLKNLGHTLDVIKRFGLFAPTIKKITGNWGITSISNKKIRNEITSEEAILLLLDERKDFINSFSENIYVESSYHYFGLIDILPNVFKNHRLVYLVRDGREWVRSHMNREWYTTKNIPSIFRTILTPDPKDKYYKKWNSMSRFEKICWAWVKINKSALEGLKKNPNAKLFYFEDIFNSNQKYENLKKLVDFATFFSDFKVNYKTIDDKLEKKVNMPNEYKFPIWKNWSNEQKKQFNAICGPLMSKLGYGDENDGFSFYLQSL